MISLELPISLEDIAKRLHESHTATELDTCLSDIWLPCELNKWIIVHNIKGKRSWPKENESVQTRMFDFWLGLNYQNSSVFSPYYLMNVCFGRKQVYPYIKVSKFARLRLRTSVILVVRYKS